MAKWDHDDLMNKANMPRVIDDRRTPPLMEDTRRTYGPEVGVAKGVAVIDLIDSIELKEGEQGYGAEQGGGFDPYFGKKDGPDTIIYTAHDRADLGDARCSYKPPENEQPADPTQKATNPKDAIGSKKHFFSTIPFTVMRELGVAMLEGCKYGRHNYRVAGARASVYFDATMRHLTDWWEFRDDDPESAANIHEITKAIASLTVLRDAMICGKFVDDRPPPSPAWHKAYVQEMTTKLLDTLKFKPPYVRGDKELR